MITASVPGPNPDPGATLAWCEADAVPAARRPDTLWDWLIESGSLTQRLRARTGAAFRLTRLAERFESLRAADAQRMGLTPPQQALLREVVLARDTTALVYAISVIPDATLAAHRWLAELGDRPLGEALFAVPGVTREPLEIARLAGAHPLAARALRAVGESRDAVWARRSVVRIGGHPLLIHEVFVTDPDHG
jgi:chorismate--pyruvate lyase